jgi:hypothetical protein
LRREESGTAGNETRVAKPLARLSYCDSWMTVNGYLTTLSTSLVDNVFESVWKEAVLG